jgi:hypothetical protein
MSQGKRNDDMGGAIVQVADPKREIDIPKTAKRCSGIADIGVVNARKLQIDSFLMGCYIVLLIHVACENIT